MAKHVTPGYGFETIVVGGLRIFTCKILCSLDAEPFFTGENDIPGIQIRKTIDWSADFQSGAYPKYKKLYVGYTLTDEKLAESFKKEIAKRLEQYAMEKITRKYAWAH